MSFGQSLRRVLAVVIAVGFLQGCGEGQALPPSDAKSSAPAPPPKNLETVGKKKAKGNIPKAARGQGPAPGATE